MNEQRSEDGKVEIVVWVTTDRVGSKVERKVKFDREDWESWSDHEKDAAVWEEIQNAPTANERFPELDQFELELKLNGGWSTFRADEHEVAAHVLTDVSAVSNMLSGCEVQVEASGARYRCRLTPKAWLAKKNG